MSAILNSTPILLLVLSGLYFAVVLPAMVIRFHLGHPGPNRPSPSWWGAFLVWPLGFYIYAILNIPRKLYAVSAFFGIIWILFAITVGVAAAGHVRKDMKSSLTHCEDVIVKAKGLTRDQKADLNGSVMILKNEVKRTGLFEFDKQTRQHYLIELLNKYLEDNEVSPQELSTWTDLYKKRNPASL